MSIEEGTEFELVFEGPSDNLPETLRKIKAVFIADLEYEIASVQKVLSEAPVKLLTTDDESEALAISNKLNSAGAKVTIIRSKKNSPQEHSIPSSIEIDLDDFIVAPHTERNQPVNTYVIDLPEEDNLIKASSSATYYPDDVIQYEDEDQYFQENYDEKDADTAVEELLQQLSTPLVNNPLTKKDDHEEGDHSKDSLKSTPNQALEEEEELTISEEDNYESSTSQIVNTKTASISTDAKNIIHLTSEKNEGPLFEIEDDKPEQQNHITSSINNHINTKSNDKTLTSTESTSTTTTVSPPSTHDALDGEDTHSQYQSAKTESPSSTTEDIEKSQNVSEPISDQAQSDNTIDKHLLVSPATSPFEELGEKPTVLISIAQEKRRRDPIRRLIIPVSLMMSTILLVASVVLFTNKGTYVPNFDLESLESIRVVEGDFSLSDASVIHGTKTEQNYTVAATCLFIPKLAGKCAITLSTPPPRELTPQEIVTGTVQPPWLYRTETGAFVISQQGADEKILSGAGVSRVFIQYKGLRVRVPGNHNASLIYNEPNQEYLIDVKIFSKELPKKSDAFEAISIAPNDKGDHQFLLNLSIPVKIYPEVDPLTVSLEKGTFNPVKKE